MIICTIYVLGCLLSWRDTGELCPRVTIGALPDDVLLEIFEPYLDLDDKNKDNWLLAIGLYEEETWQTLVHVCFTWRRLVFTSPRRLSLRLWCKNTRPVRKMLNVWPNLPINISAYITNPRRPGTTNIIYALKQRDRVYKINIWRSPNSLLKQIAAVKRPFPALTFLFLSSQDENPLVLPDSFLGGSAPRLQELYLNHIPFPALGKLLLSTRDLVTLFLSTIPRLGYILPDAIVTCISTLTKLEHLTLNFKFPHSRDESTNRYPPPLARVDLPALTELKFKGNSKYLEDIISRIDTPRLRYVEISFFNQLIFHTPHLRHFVGRTELFRASHSATALFERGSVQIRLFSRETINMVCVGISCEPLDWQPSSLTQVCNSFQPPLRTLELLRIYSGQRLSPQLQDDIPENTEWLEFLYQFTSTKDLELSKNIVPLVLPALGDLTGERATEVLPALQNIVVEELPSSGPVREAIDQFVASRQLSGCPVNVCQREIEWYWG